MVATPKVGLGIDAQRHISGGSEGGGVLPFVGVPGSLSGRMNDATTSTVGLVFDVQRLAVAGTLVVVTHPSLGVVAQEFTGANGQFVVSLPEFAQLELALPDHAIAGIEITAGSPLIIFAP